MLPPVAAALGMYTVAWSANLTDARAAEVGVARVDHDEFFASSDVISVHLKLSPRSHGYIGRGEFELMKPTALFVNTSRGPVVDEAALLDALRTRRIAGAALDVYDREPLPARWIDLINYLNEKEREALSTPRPGQSRPTAH